MELYRRGYYPFGEERYALGVAVTDYGFTGQREESSFGLYDYNARYYDPYLNRFVSPDTIVPDIANPQDWNRYTYVRNNPVRHTDPSGHTIPTPPQPDQWTEIVPNSDVLAIVGCFLGRHCNAETLRDQNGDRTGNTVLIHNPPGYYMREAIGTFSGFGSCVQMAGALDDAVRAAGAADDIAAMATRLADVGIDADEVADLARRIAEAATQGGRVQGGITMLGTYPEYVDQAGSVGATFMNMSQETWTALRDAGLAWEVNRQFLELSMEAGHSFVVTIGMDSGFWRGFGEFLTMEIDYLLNNGYEFVNGILVQITQ